MIRTRIIESKMATVKTISRSILLSVFVFILISNDRVGVAAFSTLSSSRTKPTGTRNNGGVNSIPTLFSKNHEHDRIEIDNRHSESELPTAEIVSACQNMGKQTTAIAAGVAIAIATASTTLQPANAYIPSDYASETVQSALKDLKSASGKADETFKIYESIAAIITEGKGVGGQVNYQGVELNRGYVADEDTTIYNPGLSLLTESEKERLVEGVIDNKKAGLKANQWTEENEYAFEFLRTKLDPYHMYELRGFLGIVPYYGAAVYLVVLAIQQLFRSAFQIAYIVGVVAFFAPIIALVLAGP